MNLENRAFLITLEKSMLKFLEQRWVSLGIMIAARRSVNELRAKDEEHIVENFFASEKWGKVLAKSRIRSITIQSSILEGSKIFVNCGQLLYYQTWEKRNSCMARPLTAEQFHSTLTNIRLYRGSPASVLRKFIGDTDRALLRLAI